MFDEELADFAQLQGGCRRAVDIAARAAAGIEYATQDQFVLGFDIIGCQPGTDRRQRGDVEGRCNLGLVATGAHDAGIGALAQRQRQGIDEDRLAGPGFPSQGAKTGRKFELQPVDDDEIADRKVAQHQSSNT